MFSNIGLPLSNGSPLAPITTETLASEKSCRKISMTGKVRTISPMLLSDITNIFLIVDLLIFISNLFDDAHNFVNGDGLHTHIVRAFQIITRRLVTADLFMQKRGPAFTARPGNL